MKSLILCSSLVSGKGVSLGSYSPSHTALQYWLPLDFMRSISSWVKLAMEIDLTRWGGLRPRKRPEQEVQTKDPIVMLMYVVPRWRQSKQVLLASRAPCSRSTRRFLSSCFLLLVAMFGVLSSLPIT